MLSINSWYLSAMTAYRYYIYNSKMAMRAMVRLSSGLRINSAADDPSGLCISERMRAQIRGIGQAKRNAQDTISMLQTAEGAASSVHSLLQRAKELSVQAANGTLTDNDRKKLDAELQQILEEIDTTAHNAEFNGIKLLDRDKGEKSKIHTQIGPNSGQSMEIELRRLNADSLGIKGTDIKTRKNADKAIDLFGKAIEKVSGVRSYYGATINRLEHTIDNLENYEENLTDAESRIRDADVAKELMDYTKYSLQAQVAQMMMAQANQQAQSVLYLLKASLGHRPVAVIYI